MDSQINKSVMQHGCKNKDDNEDLVYLNSQLSNSKKQRPPPLTANPVSRAIKNRPTSTVEMKRGKKEDTPEVSELQHSQSKPITNNSNTMNMIPINTQLITSNKISKQTNLDEKILTLTLEQPLSGCNSIDNASIKDKDEK